MTLDRDAMLATVRHNLVANHRAAVRRRRRFEVWLVDPTVVHAPVTWDAYQTDCDPAVRRLLGRFDECRVFLPDEAEAGSDDWRPGGSVAERLERYLDHRARLGELEATHVAGLRARWSAVGARPGAWLERYRDLEGRDTRLSLTEPVRDDAPFWWWLLCGGLNTWLMLAPGNATGPADVLADCYDPFTVAGAGKRRWARPMAAGERETTRSGRWRLVIHPHELYGSIVASGPTAQLLFEEATARATLTRRLWARGG